tara:strand:+ start:5331 stop:6218 length:888 start_codon:yes stop_codon:yes gene_type:complete
MQTGQTVAYKNKYLPYLLLAPQLIITLVFFIWPATEALFQSLMVENTFGTASRFVWFENFEYIFEDSHYLYSMQITGVFAAATTLTSMSFSLLLAVMADRVIKGSTFYKTFLIWPYAVAPAIAGILWYFMFNPSIGILAYFLQNFGYAWNHQLNGNDAMILIVLAAAWKQISYNFLFFLAGLQSIPRSLLEAAALDGASPFKRFWDIVFPLLSPTTFFLMVVNVVYAFFDTFGIVHATTAGGPASATSIMVYKVFNDGFVGLDYGSSAAQSVILLLIVGFFTIIQFRYVERKVEY